MCFGWMITRREEVVGIGLGLSRGGQRGLFFFYFFSVLLAIGVGSSLSMKNDEVLFVWLDG